MGIWDSGVTWSMFTPEAEALWRQYYKAKTPQEKQEALQRARQYYGRATAYALGTLAAGMGAVAAAGHLKAAAVEAGRVAQAQAQLQGLSGLQTAGAVWDELKRVEQLIAEAQAKGDIKMVNRLLGRKAQLLETLGTLEAVRQIGKERMIGNYINLLQIPTMWGFTIEEWRQTTMFRENLEIMRQLQEQRDRTAEKQMAVLRELIQSRYAQIAAQERAQAFWAWYLQEKQRLQQQQAMMNALKRQMSGLRRGRGRSGMGFAERMELERFKAMNRQWQEVQRTWREYIKWMGMINKEAVRQNMETYRADLQARWQAYLNAQKAFNEMLQDWYRHQYEMKEIAAKAHADIMKKQAEAAVAVAKEQAEAMKEAVVAREKARAEIAVTKAETLADLWRIAAKAQAEAALRFNADLQKALAEANDALRRGEPFTTIVSAYDPAKGWIDYEITVEPKRDGRVHFEVLRKMRATGTTTKLVSKYFGMVKEMAEAAKKGGK